MVNHPTGAGGVDPNVRVDRIGTTTDEWRLFLSPNGAIEHISAEVLAGTVTAYGLPVEATLAGYRVTHPDANPGDLLSALLGDWYVGIPVDQLADSHAHATARTFRYEFAWRSPQFAGRVASVRTPPSGDHAFRHDVGGRGRPPIRGARTVGRCPLITRHGRRP